MKKWKKALLILLMIFAILFWLTALFFGFFLGGSPGPGYERSVPLAYAGVMALGLLGAAVGLAGIAADKGAKPLLIAAALGVAGSLPFFLMGLYAAGLAALLAGAAPLLGLARK